MWIEETKKGYRLVERYKDPLTGKTKRASVKLEKNTKQAVNKARLKLMDKIESNLDTSILYDDISFEELYEEFKKIRFPLLKSGTQRNYEYMFKRITQFLDKNTIISNITTRQLNLIFVNLNNDIALGTMKGFKTKLQAIFEYAVDNKMLKENPVNKVTLSSNVPSKGKTNFLENKEIKEVLKLVYETNYLERAFLTEFLIFTGVRIGEALNLTWDKVDFRNRTIEISGDLKTENSKRIINFSNNIKEILEYLYNNRKNELVFNINKGTYAQFLNKINYKKHLHPHLFRHTHISMLAESGVNVKAIMKRVGHADSKITLEIYTHVTSKMEDELIDKLDNFFK